MAEPLGVVKVDARGGHDYFFAAVGFEVGALALDALGTGGVGDLFLPADERGEGIGEMLFG